MKKITIIILVLVCALNAKIEYWKGTIGESKIYLELECYEDSSCSSLYFYESTLQDIVIAKANRINKHHYKLEVLHNDEVKERFLLTKKSNNLLIGTWKGKDKTFNVKLNSFKLSDNDDTFSTYRIKFLKYHRSKAEKLQGSRKELVWIEEEHSKTLFFRLGNGFSKSSREHLNPIFDKLQDEFSIATLSCSSRFDYASGMDPIHERNTYLTDNLIGAEFLLNYYCGGAYPDFNTRRYLYDLHTGQEYELTDIITIGEDPIKLRELAFKAEGMHLKAKNTLKEDSYDPYDIEHWRSAGWLYTTKGIRIYLDFVTPLRCFRGDYYLIPFKLLEPYRNPSFKYKFSN